MDNLYFILEKGESIAISLLWLLLVISIFHRMKVFSYSAPAEPEKHSSAFIVIGAFFIFFFTQLMTLQTFNYVLKSHDDVKACTLQYPECLLSLALALGTLLAYTSCKPTALIRQIWGEKFGIYNFLLGAVSWFFAYPLVNIFAHFASLIVFSFYNGPQHDQLAIKHIKDAMTNPQALQNIVLSVVLIVPVVEELLFRGYLQSWLRQKMSAPGAILLTSLIFSAFHFSTDQGANNVEIVGSLFVLSCVLGWLYQTRRSLWAPIGLHMVFNAITTAAIFFKERNIEVG